MDKDEQVAVEQIDRSEAWPFRPSCYKADDAEKWLSGLYDSVPVIQAFARHRARALEASQSRAHWATPLGAVDEANTILNNARRNLLEEKERNSHLSGVYEPALAALEPAFSAVQTLRDAAAALSTPTRIEAAQTQEPCPKCGDSGYIELASGGIWTGENISSRHELCDCACGDDARDQENGTGLHAKPTPPQAAESGLLDERAAILAWLRSPVGKGSEEGVDYADAFADAIERGAHISAKAGKQGEGDRDEA